MQKVLFLLSPLALLAASCGPASAHALDASSDLDCALTTFYFHEAAVRSGAPEKPTKALYIFNQWFAASLKSEGKAPSRDELADVSDAIQSSPANARQELQACMARVAQDVRFNRFADGMGWRSVAE